MRARAAKPCHAPLDALAQSGKSAAAGDRYGSKSPSRSRRNVLRISLFQNTSHRGRLRSARNASVNPTVFVDSVSNFAAIFNRVFLVKASKIGFENSES